MLMSEFVMETKFFGRTIRLAGHVTSDIIATVAIDDGHDLHYHMLNPLDGVLPFGSGEPIVFRDSVFVIPDGFRGVTGKQSVPVIK